MSKKNKQNKFGLAAGVKELFSNQHFKIRFVGSSVIVIFLMSVFLLIILSLGNSGASYAGNAPQIDINSTYEHIESATDSPNDLISSYKIYSDIHSNRLNGSSVSTLSRLKMDDLSPLNYKDTSERVNILQSRLDELGFLNVPELTDYFGPATREAVEAFQRQHSLPVTGNADTITLELMFSSKATHYMLREGMEGNDVFSLQEQLADLCYLDSVTGYFGTLTTQAVKDFQSKNSLNVTGYVDLKTLDVLYGPDVVGGDGYEKKEKRRVRIREFVAIAKDQLGKPYSLGSHGPKRFDCSGLVYYCLRQAGSGRGRLSAQGYSQVRDWEKLDSLYNLEIGDLIFFYNRSKTRIGHVGIYVGGGMMVDASTSEGKVVYRSCRTAYWKRLFAFARRPW